MSRDKQIEEMANEIMKVVMRNRNMRQVAETLYNAGYRKASDVAREIFEEIEKALDNSVETEYFKGTWFNFSKFKQRLAELKKEIRKRVHQ